MSEITPNAPSFITLEDKHELELGSLLAPKFLSDGTIPAITVDAETNDVLMFAYMNKESLSLSLQTHIVHYWSRSRNKIWLKGETSGNVQHIKEICVDCDQDVILLKVDVAGHGANCHNGYRSCFYRSIVLDKDADGQAELTFNDDKPLFDPKDVY